jgi:TP53 regulating kinase and related kinases
METLIKQGAEAFIYLTTWKGRNVVKKVRTRKSWRNETLDKILTKSRTKQEVRCIVKALEHINVPQLYDFDLDSGQIYMEYIVGIQLKSLLIDIKLEDMQKISLLQRLGRSIAKLHEAGIIHGDLTTSNVLVEDGTDRIVLIDFGLSECSFRIEDRAVDLYLLERTLISSDQPVEIGFKSIMEGYIQESPKSQETTRQLEKVRMRGRKRTMIG